MEHTDTFEHKILLVAKDQTSAKEIQHYFSKAGLLPMDAETGITNVIPKITKDPDFQAIILQADTVGDVSMYINKLRANRSGAQMPIVVLAPNEDVWLNVTRAYDAGATFVVTSPLDEDVANHICWLLDSLFRFVGQYKENLERFYRR